MRPETKKFLEMADFIPGYGSSGLIADLTPMVLENRFYTTAQVAERYGVSKQTVRNWIDSGEMRVSLSMGDGGAVRISSADLAEFETNHAGKRS
jgi:excisionase family DNA binding protein